MLSMTAKKSDEIESENGKFKQQTEKEGKFNKKNLVQNYILSLGGEKQWIEDTIDPYWPDPGKW